MNIRIKSINLGPINMLFFAVCFLSLLTANPLLSIYALLTLHTTLYLLWKPYLPLILLYGLSFQWIQSSVRVFQANLVRENINQFDQSMNAGSAVFVSLTTVLLMSIVLNQFIKRSTFNFKKFKTQLRSFSPLNVFLLYFIFSIIIIPLLSIFKRGGLAQIIIAIESLKWVLYVLLLMVCIVKREGYFYFLAVFGTEFILGFTGFFSGFKTPILFAGITTFSFIQKMNYRSILGALGVIIILIVLSLFWTSIKTEYRGYLNQGSKSQAVYVSDGQALDYITKEITSISLQEIYESLDVVLSRIQYTQMIQFSMDYVPKNLPHESGLLWWKGLTHVFTPRIFFPNKAALDDSKVTSKYTGIGWAGADRGVSISLGYIGEAYVDFGRWGMFFPISLLAILVGIIYKSFLKAKRKYPSFEFAAIIVLLFQFSRIETSTNKLLGGMIMYWVVYAVIIRPYVFPIIYRTIRK